MGQILDQSFSPDEISHLEFVVDPNVIGTIMAKAENDPALMKFLCRKRDDLDLMVGMDIDTALEQCGPVLADLLEEVFWMVAKVVPEFIEARITNLAYLIDAQPTYPRLARLGGLYLKDGDFESAINIFTFALEKAISLEGRKNTLLKLANIYKTLGDTENLVECFDQILLLDPNNPYIYFELAQYFDMMGDFPDAFKHIKMALEMNPKSSALCFFYGDLLFKYGEWARAKVAYENGFQIDPNNDCVLKKYEVVIQEMKKEAVTKAAGENIDDSSPSEIDEIVAVYGAISVLHPPKGQSN
ncbi:MAG: tetratricopeptide repeat protein [Candidatus Gracilibacteria bacterium]|jgi:tetratricopeptide (TPR) repeat protein